MTNFNVETLRALLARAESAMGPDTELDGLIHVAFCGIAHDRVMNDGAGWAMFKGRSNLVAHIGHHNIPKITASIDAATALIERVLPGHNIRFSSHAYINGVYQGDGKSIVTIYSPLSSGGPPRWTGIGNNYALSYCSALLRALIHIAEARAND